MWKQPSLDELGEQTGYRYSEFFTAPQLYFSWSNLLSTAELVCLAAVFPLVKGRKERKRVVVESIRRERRASLLRRSASNWQRQPSRWSYSRIVHRKTLHNHLVNPIYTSFLFLQKFSFTYSSLFHLCKNLEFKMFT